MKSICDRCKNQEKCVVGSNKRKLKTIDTDKCQQFFPWTNFDKITSNPQKLATFLQWIKESSGDVEQIAVSGMRHAHQWLDWLNKEANP